MHPKLERRLVLQSSSDWEAIRQAFLRLRFGHHQHLRLGGTITIIIKNPPKAYTVHPKKAD